MPGQDIRVALIGAGRWGMAYVGTLLSMDDVELAWIFSQTEASLRKAVSFIEQGFRGKKLPRTTTDFGDILSDQSVDAVIIATPASTHGLFARKALECGKHVLVEKPFVFSAKEAEDLIDLARKRQRILLVGHLHHFNPAVCRLKEGIARGIFGKIHYIQSFGAGNGPVRTDMNALWDYFPHDLTIILFLLGQSPTHVQASGMACTNPDREDIVAMTLFFPGSLLALAEATWIYPMKKREVVVAGERGFAIFDDYAQDGKLRYYLHRPSPLVAGNKSAQETSAYLNNLQYEVVDIGDQKPLTGQVAYFLECIKKEQWPAFHVEQARLITKILEAADKSMKTKRGFLVID